MQNRRCIILNIRNNTAHIVGNNGGKKGWRGIIINFQPGDIMTQMVGFIMALFSYLELGLPLQL